METRNVKALLNKSGGERGGSLMTRVTIPAEWAREMEIDMDNRNLKLSFDGETITINKGENTLGKAKTIKMNEIVFYDEETDRRDKIYTDYTLDEYVERFAYPYSKENYTITEDVEVYPYISCKPRGDITVLINFRKKVGKVHYNLYGTYEDIEEMLEDGYVIAIRGVGEIDSIEDLI